MTACVCKFEPDNTSPATAEFHRRHRAHHLRAFPNVDQTTAANLNRLVDTFERAERLADEAVARAHEQFTARRTIEVVDASDAMDVAMARVQAAIATVAKDCGSVPMEMITTLIGAITTIAADHPESDELIHVAIEALKLTRRMVAKTKTKAAKATTGRMPS